MKLPSKACYFGIKYTEASANIIVIDVLGMLWQSLDVQL